MVRLSAAQRREAIVSAAIPLFARRGFDAITTREIAAAAGVSEALLYKHFASKEAIYSAIQGNCVAEAAEPVDMLKRLPDDTNTLVVCIYALMWKVQGGRQADSKHAQMHRLMCRSLLEDGDFAAQFLRRTCAIWIDKMRACLAAAIETKDVVLHGDDAELGIWMGHHLSVTISLYSLSGVDIVDYPGDRSRLLERTVEFCLRGIGMTEAAIAAHYHPEQLALLLGQAALAPLQAQNK